MSRLRLTEDELQSLACRPGYGLVTRGAAAPVGADADEARAFLQQPAPEPVKARRKREPGQFRSKTEARFPSAIRSLFGFQLPYRHEPFSLILANGGTADQVLYTPDFVLSTGGELPDWICGCRLTPAVADRIEELDGLMLVEVKPGKTVERATGRGRDSIVRFKTAAALFSLWSFYLARWERGAWSVDRVGGGA